MFWFKLSIPDVSTFQLTVDMTILGNRRTRNWSQPNAYRFYFSSSTGNIEFTARGSGAFPTPVNLITRPYLDRWYHLAAVRSGASSWSFYVDGRALPGMGLPDIGNSGNADGVSIGGKGTAERFYGEIQEFSVFHRSFTPRDVNTNRLRDVPLTFPNLRGHR